MPLELPPINAASPLIAQQPIEAPPTAPDISYSSFLSFDTFELQHALMRSRQQDLSLIHISEPTRPY